MIWWIGLLCAVRIALISALKPLETETHLHQLCLRYLHWRDLPAIYNGLVCGAKDIDVATESLFLTTGLYHLIVVSGSHLAFIDKYMEKWISKRSAVKWITLLAFCYVCKFNAPVFRALVSYSCIALARRLYLFLRDDQIVLLSGLTALALFPEWISSLSLQLSWMAALCMSLQLSAPKKALLFLLYLFPLLGWQNPAWALNNVLFLQVFEIFLFPLTAVTTLIPGTSGLAHWIWNSVFRAMDTLLFQSFPSAQYGASVTQNWIFVFGAQLFHFWIRR